ncbi:HAD family hydrolase [Neorhodopirellula lusitana]|uniref:HAD family hydrolase n=1 Tax=Neorhodopirellula lusitana TaxID=445327 RepID=UPI00384E0F5E
MPAPETKSYQSRVLATDLDGTFIPLDGDGTAEAALATIAAQITTSQGIAAQDTAAQNNVAHAAGEQIAGQSGSPAIALASIPLAFVTGRHLESVYDAIVSHGLPKPGWILCDVGTSIYQRKAEIEAHVGDQTDVTTLVAEYERVNEYDDQLDSIVGKTDVEALRSTIAGFEHFRIQEPFKQGPHKLSYYVPAERLEFCRGRVQQYLDSERLPYSVIASVDPFNNDGLVDLLPLGVSKAFALDWWCRSSGYHQQEVVFCGDSGNDTAALVAGYSAVVVGNAKRSLAAEIHAKHQENGWHDRLYLASATSTGGVLEGMKWFGLQPNVADPTHWGATPLGHRRTRFSLYAPAHEQAWVILQPDEASPHPRRLEMERSDCGQHTLTADECPVGTRYLYEVGCLPTNSVGHSPTVLPDPASRFQPEGVHGPSQIVGRNFPWQHDTNTCVKQRNDLIIYELHVGAFTNEGNYASAAERLDELKQLGITAIELMPIAECPGRWNWGYDATHWFAPMHRYGSPDDLRRFVDAAHSKGILVFADVVYNHFGPEGNYWSQLGDYLSEKHHTPWGAAPNFDEGSSSTWIRRLVIDNAIEWLDAYHLDGLRVDAIHCMADDSEDHITQQFGREVNQWAADANRRVWLIAESNVYDQDMTASLDAGGTGFDAQWCDDFAHSLFAVVRPGERLTVRTYEPGSDLAQTLRRGFVFQGDVRGDRGREEASKDAEGTTSQVARVDSSGMIYCIQNHDFIGNHPTGKRFHQLTSLQAQAAAAATLILSPAIPMLFMGEEFACENPFAFFVDFGDNELREAVVAGRKREYPQHDWSDGVLPIDAQAFESARIGAAENGDASMLEWYRALIAMRKEAVASGVLHTDRVEVRADATNGIYLMRYQHQSQALTVLSRLGTTEQVDATIPLSTIVQAKLAQPSGLDPSANSTLINTLSGPPRLDSLLAMGQTATSQEIALNQTLVWFD